MKVCTKCKEAKEETEFYKGPKVYWCKACWSYSKIENLYKLNKEQYSKLIENGCNICGSHSFLQVDHDHTCCPGVKSCGKCVRGVLCKRHNIGLGLIGESIEELEAAQRYLIQKTNVLGYS